MNQRFRIAHQLSLLAAVSLTGMVALALYSLHLVDTTTGDVRRAESKARINGEIYEGLMEAKDVTADVLPPPAYVIEAFLVAHQLALSANAQDIEVASSKLTALRNDYDARHAFWSQHLGDGPLRTALLTDAHGPAQQFFAAVENQLLPAVKLGDHAAAQRVVEKELANAYAAQRSAIDHVVKLAAQQTSEHQQTLQAILAQSERDLHETLRSAKIALFMGLAIVITCASGVGLAVSHRITKRIRRMAVLLREATLHLASSSEQMEKSSHLVAAGSSQQAAALEETSSSLEQMESVTKTNVDGAIRADQLVRETHEAAGVGATDMQAMKVAMEEIQRSSGDIAKIIQTVDEIAFQTNLLALNAAIEAARAGDAGLGFAVVAEEVRRLAQRSASAAKETAEKIRTAIDKTEQGVEINRKVSTNLEVIVVKVTEVNSLISSVAAASREQSQGISQINTAVSEMDTAVQSNAAGAEQTASASKELRAQAASLQELVGDLVSLVGEHGRSGGGMS